MKNKKIKKLNYVAWEGAPGNLQILGPRFKIRLWHILKIIKKIRPKKMLEIGAGNGNMALFYSRYVKNLLLTDIAQEAVNEMRRKLKNRKNIRYKKLNIIKDKLNERFDFILLSEVLEHIQDDKDFLIRARELLNDRGKILITVPSNEKYRGTEDNVGGHLRRYCSKDVQKLMRECGLKIKYFIGWGYPLITSYYKKYNQNYYIPKHKQRKEIGIIRKILIDLFTLISYYAGELCRNSYDMSFGFILLLEKQNERYE